MGLLNKNVRENVKYIDTNKKNALLEFKKAFSETFMNSNKFYTEIVILCIGTDRATGDSLGPLIGYKLKKLPIKREVFIYGTLNEPVHARNIEETVNKIYKIHKYPMVIAIDASLGSIQHIGYITVGNGNIRPGAGVKKNLVPVGDIFITGIVNFSGVMDVMLLQNTRLALVMQIADIISNGIWMTFPNI